NSAGTARSCGYSCGPARVAPSAVSGDGGASRITQGKAHTMAVNQIQKASRIRAADGLASTASGMRSRSHRAGPRLWALLNAQALLNGAAGTPGGVAHIEDDRRRMAARRSN